MQVFPIALFVVFLNLGQLNAELRRDDTVNIVLIGKICSLNSNGKAISKYRSHSDTFSIGIS